MFWYLVGDDNVFVSHGDDDVYGDDADYVVDDGYGATSLSLTHAP